MARTRSEVGLLELEGREVHGDLKGAVPARRLAAGRPQHPFAEGHDEPALLGQGHEDARRHEPARGVAPAHQRLEPHEVPPARGHLRLVVEREFVRLDGLAEVAFEVAAFGHRLVHGGFEHAVGVPPLQLRPVEGEVGALEHLLAALAVLRHQGDADAEADLHPLLAEGDRRVHGKDEAPRQILDGGEVASLGHQHGELVAAQAGHHILRVHLHPDAVGDGAQHRIPREVAEAVVDGLEPVEVEAQHRRRASALPEFAEPFVEAIVE